MGSHARPNWTQEEIAKLKELCETGLYSFKMLAEKFGRPERGIMYKCYEQGFKNPHHPCWYTHNEHFFKDVTYETCYWAAILVTDGCLSYNRGFPSIRWTTAVRDKSHIELFVKTIQSNHPIKHKWSACNLSTKDDKKLFESCVLAIETPKSMIPDLERNFGFTSNKTKRFPPPRLPSLQHELSFIRGYIDGDGTITPGGKNGGMSIAIGGINRDIIAWIKETIEGLKLPSLRTKNTESLIYQNKRNNDQSYYWATKGMSAAILFEILRSLPVPNLSRKWDNPEILLIIDYWKSRTDVWPVQSFFDNFFTNTTITQ